MDFRKYAVPVFAFLVGGFIVTSLTAASPSPITVGEARNLSPGALAVELVGDRLGSTVIQAVRHEYQSSSGVPREVELFTQPKSPWPRINGICFTDVIRVEYDWFEHDEVDSSSPLRVFHVEATSRFKSFPMPPDELEYEESGRFQDSECAKIDNALDAFRAPSAGDAQWLAAMEKEYRQISPGKRRFQLSCSDFADASCVQAANALIGLRLSLAIDVQPFDCPTLRHKDQVNYCYRLTFPYSGMDDPEWVVSIVGGMANGMAPVEIRSLNIEHVEKPFVIS